MPRLSKAGSTVERPEHQGGLVARHHRRQADRADEQRADQGGEGQIDEMRSALAQAGGGAGEAARAEGALVQALDGLGIDGLLGTDRRESSVMNGLGDRRETEMAAGEVSAVSSSQDPGNGSWGSAFPL